MTGRHVGVSLIVALLAAATAGCSDDASDDPPSTTPTSTSSTSSSPPSTSPPPTPEEAASEAALAVVDDYWQVSESVRQAPAARDWEPELRQYGDAAVTAGALGTLQFFLEGGQRQEGVATIEAEVSSVDLAADPQPTVMVTACLDPTTARDIDAETGEPAPEPPPDQRPPHPRWELQITVLQYPEQAGSPWLVHDLEALTEQPC